MLRDDILELDPKRITHKKELEALQEKVRHAPCFDVTNIRDFVWNQYATKGGKLDIGGLPNCRPCFKTMWLEARSTGLLRGFGCLVREIEALEGETLPVVLLIFVLVDRQRNPVSRSPTCLLSLTANYNVNEGLLVPTKADLSAEIEAELFAFATCVAYTLAIMNCRGVQVTREEPSRALNKRRIERNKEPFVAFHHVAIRPSGVPTKDQHGPSSEGAIMPLHTCRAHIADYRSGKGLFGKYKTSVWIGEHIRGSAEVGIVLKDYRIPVATVVAATTAGQGA